MIKLLILLLFISSNVFAQSFQQNDLLTQQAIINKANAAIASDQADITNQQAIITSSNLAISNDNNIIIQYSAQNAQNISGVNWDYFDTLEIAGVRYSTFSTVTPGVNWPNITSELNITCPVSESSVNWTNWHTCENKGVNWSSFYCAQGSC